jgi:hypothetical protein
MRAKWKSVNTSWRDVLPIHPAANLFPDMTSDELRTLGEDIVKNGLYSSIALWRADPKASAQLLDGRNRLDAIEMATGKPVEVNASSIVAGEFLATDRVIELDGRKVDPWVYATSANFHRRHLTTEQKREAIAKLIKALPEKSDRQIAAMLGVSHHTVGTVRAEMEGRGQIAHVTTRTDTRGRKQPARKRSSRNMVRYPLIRAMKLGDATIDKLAGTSLDSAREIDALIYLNRGAPEGEHTPAVKRLVATAVAGQKVSAVKTKNGAPLPDIAGDVQSFPDPNESPEEYWQRSLTAMADEVIMRTTHHYWPANWRQFPVSPGLLEVATRASAAWADLVMQLNKQVALPAADDGLGTPGFLDRTKQTEITP